MRPRIGPRKTNVHWLYSYIWKGCDFPLSLLFPVRQTTAKKTFIVIAAFPVKMLTDF